MGCKFKAISDERRRLILRILGYNNEASAGEIASKFNISQPTVSNHLRILKEAGLIKERKEKQSRIYSLNKPELRKVIETLTDIVREP